MEEREVMEVVEPLITVALNMELQINPTAIKDTVAVLPACPAEQEQDMVCLPVVTKRLQEVLTEVIQLQPQLHTVTGPLQVFMPPQ